MLANVWALARRAALGSLFAMPEVCGSAELRFARRRFAPGAGSPGGRARWARRAASQASHGFAACVRCARFAANVSAVWRK